MLPSGPSSQDNPTAMRSKSPQASLAALPCRARTRKARAQCCVCLPTWASHPQEENPEELGQKNLLLLTTHLCST